MRRERMRRGVLLLVMGVVVAALGAASAYAAGTTTTSATTTTDTAGTDTTPTSTTQPTTGTTTTPAPAYSRLIGAYLPAGCVGAGAAAIAEPGRRVLVLGTPASNRGPSSYPTVSPIFRFLSSTASGSGCGSARVTLESVSLFGGAITAQSISATHGRGTVRGLEIYGSPVSAGHGLKVGGWGEMTLRTTVGRLTAALAVRLLHAHRGLPAGTTIAFAFSASPQAPATPNAKKGAAPKHSGASAKPNWRTKGQQRKHKAKMARPLTATPSLGFKSSHYVFPVDGGASYIDTYGAGRSDIYDGWHHGDDLFAPLGTPIVAVATGTLSLVGWNRLGGWRLWLTDGKGNSFYYAHLAGYARSILKHRHVRAGQVIGFLGRTGDAFTTTPHLHFEIHPRLYVKLGYDGAVDPTRYLHLWQVVQVPKDEIPQPARLRAPVGTPRQEAAVVWRELLVARHLTPPKRTAPPTTFLRRPFPHPPGLMASGASPVPPTQVRPATAHVSASASNLPLLVGGPAGAALALAGATGAFFFRRRRRTTEAAPAAEPAG
ncbi:MAG TPA: M23 family metallopeptidase [Gaiellaceae bacterium]|nr:M23 family metallopeptidase [Gaiellaceae bacterium]